MTTETATLPPARAGRREWIGLAVIALPCLLYSMDLTVLNLAVPHLSADLQPTGTQLLWIVDIYGFLIAGALITMGRLGDHIGRRRLLLIGATAFGAASVFAAFATSAEMLIVARATLGVAAAALAPSTLSLISNMFRDPRERTFAIGVWAASFSAGSGIGPLLGGVMLAHFWWGSVFLLNVPVMLLLLALAPFLLPEYRDPAAGRLDIRSATLSLAAVLAVIYGVKRFVEDGAGWEPLFAILAGLALGAVFVRRQRRLSNPLIDLRLFRRRGFSVSLAVNILGVFAAFGTFLFIAQYLQLVVGMTPLQAGLWTLPSAIGFVVGSLWAPRLSRRMPAAHVMTGGFAMAACGFVLLALAGTDHGFAAVVVGLALLSLGIAPAVTLSTDMIVGTVPPERAGMASGMSETSAELGGALGIALLGSIVTAIYRGSMTEAMPADIPPAVAEAARQTLGGAVAAAQQLAERPGADLLESARDAFVLAFQAASLVSALVALGAATLVALLLRDVRTGQHPG